MYKIKILIMVFFGILPACNIEPAKKPPVYSDEYRMAADAVKTLELELLKQYYENVAFANWLKEQSEKE